MDNLGPHLLKRIESTPDERDWDLGNFQTPDALHAALAKLMTARTVPFTVKVWAKLVTDAVDPLPAPTPGPTPAPTPTPPAPAPVTVASWLDDDDPVLDQGQTGHCVGFTGADFENALPVDDHVPNQMGHNLYYACKINDGEAGQEDGSTVKSLMQVLQQRGKIKNYAAANSMDDVLKFVTTQGPICWGIGWTQSMFTPDADGLVVPSGADEGGHAIIQYGYDAQRSRCLLLNHWGPDWGVNGRFEMTPDALAERLANGGEAWAAVEIAT